MKRGAIAPQSTTGCYRSNDGVKTPYEPQWSRAVYHLYVIRTGDRDGLIHHLKDAHIGTGIHYPIPLHLQKAYISLNYAAGDFPVTERAAGEIVSLPMFPHLTPSQQVTGRGGNRPFPREVHSYSTSQ